MEVQIPTDNDNLDDDDDIVFPTETKEDKTEKSVPSVALAAALKERGLIDYELEDDEELDEVTANEIIETEFEKRVNEEVKKIGHSLSDFTKNLIEYEAKGGDPETFLSHIVKSRQTGLSPNMDISKVENQKLMLQYDLLQNGYDPEDVEFQISNLEDSGKLESMAKRRFEKYRADEAKYREQLAQQHEKELLAERQKEKEYKQSLLNVINSEDEIGVIKLSKADKTSLADFMASRTIKTENGFITPFYKTLGETLANPKAFIQVAKILKNRNADGTLNLDFIKRAATTEVTNKVKDNLERKAKKPKGTGSNPVMSFYDFLNS